MSLGTLLQRISYKPNVELIADEESDSELLWLTLRIETLCAVKRDGSKLKVELHFKMYKTIWQLMKDSSRLAWIRRCLDQAEMHEVREWLAFDSERVFDPHTMVDPVDQERI